MQIKLKIEGDIPSTCGSDYIVVVTNTTEEDVIHELAGFSEKYVDVGAPGEGIWSTNSDNSKLYSMFSGCSSSSPQVWGAIALMYSLPCEGIQKYFGQNPEKAKEIVQVLLDNVDKISSLDGLVKSGGRLNLNKFLDAAQIFCVGGNELGGISIYPNPCEEYLKIDFHIGDIQNCSYQIIDMFGNVIENEDIEVEPFSVYSIDINVSRLSKGAYAVLLEHGDNREYAKFIKM